MKAIRKANRKADLRVVSKPSSRSRARLSEQLTVELVLKGTGLNPEDLALAGLM